MSTSHGLRCKTHAARTACGLQWGRERLLKLAIAAPCARALLNIVEDLDLSLLGWSEDACDDQLTLCDFLRQHGSCELEVIDEYGQSSPSRSEGHA